MRWRRWLGGLVAVVVARLDKIRELRALLDAHNAEQAPPAWPSLIDVPVSVDKTLAEAESPDDEYIYWPN